jgi:acetyltransferase-like isoleucine patch superfamily enzyme
LIADLATVRENVIIGDRTIIGRGVAIENHCSIGERCKFETNAYLTAYSDVGSDVFVAPGVLTSNDNFLGRTKERFKHFRGAIVKRAARIGVGAVILPGRTIGEEAVVAAGAVLTRDADAETIFAGIPARRFRPVPKEQKLS